MREMRAEMLTPSVHGLASGSMNDLGAVSVLAIIAVTAIIAIVAAIATVIRNR